MNSPNLIIYGFGNLGYHLLKLFWGRGFRNISIVTNQPIHGECIDGYFSYHAVQNESKYRIQLGEDLPIFTRNQFHEISSQFKDESIVFICVNDDNIENTLKEFDKNLNECQRVILSGGYQFPNGLPYKVSVIYPLFSFSKNSDVNWNLIPIFIESPNTLILELLRNLNLENVNYLNSQQRNLLHVAAVFANNFTNSMFIAAQEILKLSPELKMEFLLPIIQQTIDKLNGRNALELQTGPAKRGDNQTIERHKHLLSHLESEQILYEAITKYIRAKLNLI